VESKNLGTLFLSGGAVGRDRVNQPTGTVTAAQPVSILLRTFFRVRQQAFFGRQGGSFRMWMPSGIWAVKFLDQLQHALRHFPNLTGCQE
jgi:hypothetical protein